jgi:hypothetical protein
MQTIIENNRLILEQKEDKTFIRNLNNENEVMIIGFGIPKSYYDWMFLVFLCGPTFFD